MSSPAKKKKKFSFHRHKVTIEQLTAVCRKVFNEADSDSSAMIDIEEARKFCQIL
jgi:hypothetical protein